MHLGFVVKYLIQIRENMTREIKACDRKEGRKLDALGLRVNVKVSRPRHAHLKEGVDVETRIGNLASRTVSLASQELCISVTLGLLILSRRLRRFWLPLRPETPSTRLPPTGSVF